MKKLYLLTLLIHASILILAQTDGISYQAVIIDPQGQELPGVDAEGNILPDTEIAIRFTIIDANNMDEYQEVQYTHTDAYGMVNLLIGETDPDAFAQINWDGTNKELKVEIDFGGTANAFVDMSRDQLTFVPYAYHRNITAHGTLQVDDAAFLNSELLVEGPANLNSSLAVNNNNPTTLTGPLQVDGLSRLNSHLNVTGTTHLNDSFNVNNLSPTYLSGDLTVGADGEATFNGATVFKAPSEFTQIGVNGASNLNGQVTIKTNLDTIGSDTDYNAYPLLVEGSAQGIAIKVSGIDDDDPGGGLTDVPVSHVNNYISFWDANQNQMWGRIEGQSIKNLNSDYQFERTRVKNLLDIAKAGTNVAIAAAGVGQTVVKVVAASTSSTACAGLGACVTAPIPSFIVEAGTKTWVKVAQAVLVAADLVLTIENAANFEISAHNNIGVTYSSGAGDYAEWLPKLNAGESFSPGDIIGVRNGYITKNITGGDKIMVISTNPIVLGNMPDIDNTAGHEKVAFMGQVPAKVIGPVKPGDYILPSELGSGLGKAVDPGEMNTRDYAKIAGVAWKIIAEIEKDINIVNIAVGINTNDLTGLIQEQEEELLKLKAEHNQLKHEMERSNNVLASLVPGYAEAIGYDTSGTQPAAATNQTNDYHDHHFIQSGEDDIVYFEISKDQIATSLEIARESYAGMLADASDNKSLFATSANKTLNSNSPEDIPLVNFEDHPFWGRMDNDPQYREEMIEYVREKIEKAVHTHKKYSDQFTNLKAKE